MGKVEKLNELKTYVRERMDFYNDWSGKSNIKKMFEELEKQIKTLETQVEKGKELISKLQNELKEYRKLQSEVHKGIERVWSIDSTFQYGRMFPTKQKELKKERSEIIEEIFYKIGNEWIGGDYPAQLQKRTDPERWESLDDMDGSWTEDDIEKGHHLPF